MRVLQASWTTSWLVSFHATPHWDWPHRVWALTAAGWVTHSRVCAHLRVMNARASCIRAHSGWTCGQTWHHTHCLSSRRHARPILVFFNPTVWLHVSLALLHETELVVVLFLLQGDVLPFKSFYVPEAFSCSSCRWINNATLTVKRVLDTLDLTLVVGLVLRVR